LNFFAKITRSKNFLAKPVFIHYLILVDLGGTKMKRRFLTIFMAAIILVVPINMSAAAVNVSVQYTIPVEVAEIIATYFVRDAQGMADNQWTSDTAIVDTVTMYDENGAVSAYSFELETGGKDTGYVVVCAYPDVVNKVLEYSDSAEPLYSEFDLSSTDSVVYTGLLNYYEDDGDSQLLTLNNTIDRDDITAPLSELRSGMTISVQQYPITDPFEWADEYYEGPFVATEYWQNDFEAYCNYRTTGDFSGYEDHCGPTAITNLLEMIGGYNDYSSITSEDYEDIFEAVADYGIENNYYNNPGGSPRSTLPDYIEGAFDLFDVTVTVTNYTATYSRISTELENQRPFYLTLNDHSYYGDHEVAGFAYTRLQSETTGYYLSFVKIADGWSHSGRYLDISSIQSSDDATLRAIRIS